MSKFYGTNSADHLIGSTGDDTFYMTVNNFVADTVDGGLGNDTIDYSRAGVGLQITLTDPTSTGGASGGTVDANFPLQLYDPATGKYIGVEHQQLVAILTGIENVTGSDFADTITGNNENNVIEGGGGADRIDGGGGNDTVSYAHSPAAVHVDLNQAVQHGGDAEGDQLTQIENVIGSSSDDTLTGKFDGQVGLLDGGPGSDTVDYSSASRGMTIVLDHDSTDGSGILNAITVTGTIMGYPYSVSLPAVQEDALRTIENVIGTAADDTITGNAANNRLEGGAGNDTIHGGGGSDVIIGGLGGDTLYGGTDNGVDTFVYRDWHESMVHIDVVNHQVIDDGSDVIMDFQPGQDRIDLSGMEWQVAGGAKLHFLPDNAQFTGPPGEIQIFDPSLLPTNTPHNEDFIQVKIDFDGDAATDFFLTVTSPLSLTSPTHSDFIL